jgi:oligopeptide/dipeptide ABC transporter ATP-binding protein
MQNEPILQVKHLNATLQIEENVYSVVQDLSFDLMKGKTLAIVGESGCGKTFTALSMMRLLSYPPALPATGEVLYKGKNLLTISENEMRKLRGGKIAMIFQDPASALNPVYRIGDQLMESASLHRGLYGQEAFDLVIQALEEVHIASPKEKFYDYPHQLSGGMKQRIMIAMALIGEPDILIADEPTTALDVTIQLQVLELIKQLQRKKQMAVLLITHDMGVVAEMADEVIVMYASNQVEKGSVTEIFDKMAHPYTRGLFNSRPKGTSPRGDLEAIKGSVPSLTNYPTGCKFHPRCPYVMEKCLTPPIPDFQLDTFHFVKCLLYDGSLISLNQLNEHQLK